MLDLKQAIADQRQRSVSSCASDAGTHNGSTSSTSGDKSGPKVCPIDGQPVVGKKKFCPIHHRAAENIARNAKKGSTKENPTAEHVACPSGI